MYIFLLNKYFHKPDFKNIKDNQNMTKYDKIAKKKHIIRKKLKITSKKKTTHVQIGPKKTSQKTIRLTLSNSNRRWTGTPNHGVQSIAIFMQMNKLIRLWFRNKAIDWYSSKENSQLLQNSKKPCCIGVFYDKHYWHKIVINVVFFFNFIICKNDTRNLQMHLVNISWQGLRNANLTVFQIEKSTKMQWWLISKAEWVYTSCMFARRVDVILWSIQSEVITVPTNNHL